MDAAMLTAITSPRRREILRLLWTQERSAGAIHAAMTDVTFGAVSLQLKILLNAGVVACRPEGQHRIYSVDRQALAPVAAMLEEMWTDALWRLKLSAELEQTRRGPQPRASRSRRRIRTPRKKGTP
jgi:DNA-binding transcriptional ArsR family regulator